MNIERVICALLCAQDALKQVAKRDTNAAFWSPGGLGYLAYSRTVMVLLDLVKEEVQA